MSTYQIRKPSFLEVSRNQSTPTTSLNTTDISMNNTNLESYKKALHSIVKRLNKTPSASSKTSLKRSDSKLNQTQQPIYNTTLLNTSNSSKKYHISHAGASGNRNQSCSRRSHSNDGSYKNNKESLNKSMQETYIKKGSFSSNISKSISINKLDKAESHDVDDLAEGELLSGDNNYRRNSALNATILHDADLNNLDGDGDKKLRDLVHQYQLRDAIHRQEITKLKKSNELLRTHVYELEKELDKSKKSKDSEKRYINKLEVELSQFKERARVEAAEKKSLQSTMSEQKESQYIKAIEELKSQLTSMSSEKKLVEHLLKNALTQHDQNKSDKPPSSSSSGTHKGLDASILAATSGKYSTNAGGRPKADAFARKGSAIKIFNDENDYASYSQSQTANSSFIANSVKMSKDFDTVKEVKPVSSVFGNGNMNRVLQEGSVNNAVEPVDLPTEGDEAFPTKVFHPQPNEKSLKERIDLNRFKLDLSVISKNRKVG